MLQIKSKGSLLEKPPLFGNFFVLFRPSTDQLRLTHVMEDNLLYSKSTCLNVNLISEILTKAAGIMFDHISGHYGR